MYRVVSLTRGKANVVIADTALPHRDKSKRAWDCGYLASKATRTRTGDPQTTEEAATNGVPLQVVEGISIQAAAAAVMKQEVIPAVIERPREAIVQERRGRKRLKTANTAASLS